MFLLIGIFIIHDRKFWPINQNHDPYFPIKRNIQNNDH